MKFLILICVILSMTLVSAVPQAIFSYVNITIEGNGTSGKYQLEGEGIIATETFTLTMMQSM